MNISIIHICPTSTGGVSDYVDISIQHQSGAVKLAFNKELTNTVSLSGNVLLHYSGYGFAKRGAPLWLLNKITKDRHQIKTFGIFFHELYAFAPPWSSAFWLYPVQRHIAWRLAKLSDYWITNREDSAVWIKQFAADKPHKVLPVFSNVGEMTTYSAKRLPRVVVFGGAALRTATYLAAGDALFRWIVTQGLELHDIGPAMNDQTLNDALIKANAVVHGKLDMLEASVILAEASFGLVRYPVEYAAKSGVFAAYCAHGICPILISDGHQLADGLVAGEHYHAGIPDHPIDGTKIGEAAWDWYQPHCISIHTSTQLDLLK